MYHKLGAVLCMIIMLFDAHSAMSGTLSLNPSIQIGERYESNPDSKRDGEDLQGDFRTSITPQVGLIKEYRKHRLSADYMLGLIKYSRGTKRDYLSHRANIGMDMDISSQSTFAINDSITRTEGFLAGSEADVQIERTDTFVNIASMSLNQNLSPRTSIGMTISDRILEYGASSLLDSRTDSGSLAWTYNNNTTTSFTPRYGYTMFSYSNGIEYGYHSLDLSFSKLFSHEISIDIGGGGVYIPDFENRLDWTAHAYFTKTFEVSSLNLKYSRTVRNTTGLTDEMNINNRVSVSLGFPLSGSSNMAITGGMSRNKSNPSGRIDTESYTAGINADWRPYPWMVVSAGYLRFQQSINGDSLGGNLIRDQVFVNIAATPEGWRF